MVNYKPVKVTINVPGLVEVIIKAIVRHHGPPNSIKNDYGSVFTLKFLSLLCYFLRIKWKLSTAFQPQTNDQTERQNSIIKAYFRAFVNYKQDN